MIIVNKNKRNMNWYFIVEWIINSMNENKIFKFIEEYENFILVNLQV